MITIDSDPELNPIYIGASIISLLSELESTEIAPEKLYILVKGKFDVSYYVFALALDWLYIAGVIDINESGSLSYATR